MDAYAFELEQVLEISRFQIRLLFTQLCRRSTSTVHVLRSIWQGPLNST